MISAIASDKKVFCGLTVPLTMRRRLSQWIIPCLSKSSSARRTVVRDTFSLEANRISEGRRDPAARRPSVIHS